jgi:anti-sigma regulatory factor (Ser/Thr protein kinase)
VSSDDSIALPAGLQAQAHARAWLSERTGRMPALLVDDAMLVASELVTNALRHGRPPIALSLTQLPDGVRIAVADEGENRPAPALNMPTIDRPTGRGLLIVAATVRRWGITPHDDGPGKTVWAEL